VALTSHSVASQAEKAASVSTPDAPFSDTVDLTVNVRQPNSVVPKKAAEEKEAPAAASNKSIPKKDQFASESGPDSTHKVIVPLQSLK
jgi:hypothetical protein